MQTNKTGSIPYRLFLYFFHATLRPSLSLGSPRNRDWYVSYRFEKFRCHYFIYFFVLLFPTKTIALSAHFSLWCTLNGTAMHDDAVGLNSIRFCYRVLVEWICYLHWMRSRFYLLYISPMVEEINDLIGIGRDMEFKPTCTQMSLIWTTGQLFIPCFPFFRNVQWWYRRLNCLHSSHQPNGRLMMVAPGMKSKLRMTEWVECAFFLE